MIRQTSVADSFYPSKAEDLLASFEYFNDIADAQFQDRLYKKKSKALIVPHAGYVYSGFSANLAYRNINYIPKRVVLIGPSHKVAFEGMSMIPFDFYDTPLGMLEADRAYMQELNTLFEFNSLSQVHQEHATEVQFPFIKNYFPNTKLVEIVYAVGAKMEDMIQYILNSEDTLLLVSTDLSHFYPQEKANELDAYCIQGIENFDEECLKKAEACGMEGLQALLHVSKELALQVQSIDYRTSGDISGDKTSVVGYYSAMVY